MTPQYLSLALAFVIFAASVISMRRRPHKRFFMATWALYGLLGILYYLLILFFGVPGHKLSMALRSAQYAIVAANVVGYFALSEA